MPGKGHIPSLDERFVRTLRSGTFRTAGGLGSNASPGLTRDRVAASARGVTSGVVPGARASQVDEFTVTDSAEASFVLTYAPAAWSWNVSVNGVVLREAEFSIVGRTLTILNPGDLWLGISGNWLLRVQYDYLGSTPTQPSDGTGEAPPTTPAGLTVESYHAELYRPGAADGPVRMKGHITFGGQDAGVFYARFIWTPGGTPGTPYQDQFETDYAAPGGTYTFDRQVTSFSTGVDLSSMLLSYSPADVHQSYISTRGGVGAVPDWSDKLHFYDDTTTDPPTYLWVSQSEPNSRTYWLGRSGLNEDSGVMDPG